MLGALCCSIACEKISAMSSMLQHSEPRPLLSEISGPARGYVNRYLQVIANLPLKGIERSIKFAPGQFLHERLLVGIEPACWSPALFIRLCAELAMPPSLQQLFQVAMARANFLFVAFELGEHGCVYKAYAEFPVRVSGASRDGVAPAALQYQGFKWNPDAPDQQTITDYVWTPRLAQAAIAARCAHHLAMLNTSLLPALLEQVLVQSVLRVDARELVFLEVGESGTPRKSVDLNVYPARLALAELILPLTAIAAGFGLELAAVKTILARDAQQVLGHVSVGCDRKGGDFLTVYYDY